MKRFALLLPVIAGIMFGSVGIFVRILVAAGMDNPTVLFCRGVFAALELFIFILIFNRKLFKIKLKELWIFVGTGLVGMLCMNLCYNEALINLPVSVAAILLNLSPIFVIIFSAIFYKEKITSKKIICLIIMIVGAILVSGVITNAGGVNVKGILFGLLAAVFYALYSQFSRLATNRGYTTYTVIFYSVILLSIVLTPFAKFDVIGSYISAAPAQNILFLLLHSLLTSFLPYALLTLAFSLADSGKVSILVSGAEPSAALVLALIILAEIPAPLNVVGLIIIIFALTLLNIKTKKEKAEEEAAAAVQAAKTE